MKTNITLRMVASVIAGVGLLSYLGFAQNNSVRWSTFSMGYAASTSSSNTMEKSIVGQSFVGSMRHGNSFIESGFFADTLFRSVLVSVDDARGLPISFSLKQNYPNPFNPATRIRYELPCEAHVVLKLYNLLGQEVLSLVDERQPAGYREVLLNAGDLASGVYLYRLTIHDPSIPSVRAFADVKKLMVIK